jgi:hypothetical protein
MIEIKKSAMLDANQKAVIEKIDLACGDHRITVTRGHSTPQEQFEILSRFGGDHGCFSPEFLPDGPLDLKINIPPIGLVYHWQRTWSRLLHLGVVVNPPLPAICLDDYTRPSGEKMQGKLVHESTHISGQANGCWPIDFSAKVNGVVNFELVRDILATAQAASAGIKEIKVEHGNGCVHIDTIKII